MPIYAGVLASRCSLRWVLPGLNGSWVSFSCSKARSPLFAGIVVATIGLVITGVFLLGMMQKVCFGPFNKKWTGIADMNTREICIITVLMFFMFWIGLYPGPLLDVSNKAVTATGDLFQNLGH